MTVKGVRESSLGEQRVWERRQEQTGREPSTCRAGNHHHHHLDPSIFLSVMHSTASRLSTLSSNAVTALFTLLVAIALSSFALTPSKLEGGRLTVEPLNVSAGLSVLLYLDLSLICLSLSPDAA